MQPGFSTPRKMDNSSMPYNIKMPLVINGFVNIPLCLIAVVENSLILVSFARTPSLLSSSNVLLIGLALSDLCVGLVPQPLFIALIFERYLSTQGNVAVPDSVLRKAFFFSSQLLCAVSFLIVSALSVDRFLALYLHLRYREIVTVRRVTIYLCFLWGFSVVIASLGTRQPDIFFSTAVPGCSVLFIVNAVLYFKIYRIVRRHQLQISHQRASTSVGDETIQANSRSNNYFFSSLYLYVIYLLCMVPFLCISVLYSIVRNPYSALIVHMVGEVSTTIVFVNSSLNPLLFSWRLKDVRAAVKRTLNHILSKLSC